MKRCKVITDRGFLLLTMPDGTIIPQQTKMILENNVDMEGVSMVTITVMADTKFIKNRISFETPANEITGKSPMASALERIKDEQNNTD